MALLRDGKLVTEGPDWQHLDDDVDIVAGAITVSFQRLQSEPTIADRPDDTGVRLGPADDPMLLEALLPKLQLVTVEFPKFTDGRGYSTARLLRTRLSYRGELRAVGNVLVDQLFFMSRVGFNAFELVDGKSVDDALKALEGFSVTYQGAADDERPLFRRVRR